MSSEAIIAAWQGGDTGAAETIDILVDILASPLAMVINVTGATIVPVGGGLSNSRELITALDVAVRTRILRRFDRPLVVPRHMPHRTGADRFSGHRLKYANEVAVSGLASEDAPGEIRSCGSFPGESQSDQSAGEVRQKRKSHDRQHKGRRPFLFFPRHRPACFCDRHASSAGETALPWWERIAGFRLRRDRRLKHRDRKELRYKHIRCRDGVLNREIDANAADGRHRMGRIADADQAGFPPALQPIDTDGQKINVIPAFKLIQPFSGKGADFGHPTLKASIPSSFMSAKNPFARHNRIASNHHGSIMTKPCRGPAWPIVSLGSPGCFESRIHNTSVGNTEALDLQACGLTDDGTAAISPTTRSASISISPCGYRS